MNKGDATGLIIWLTSFAGIALIYSAVKGVSPLKLARDGITGTPAPVTTNPARTQFGLTSTGTASGSGANSSSGPLTSQVGQTWYDTDQFGAASKPIPGAYQNNPNSYIAPRGLVAEWVTGG